MTREEAIEYGEKKLDRIGYQLEMGYLNRGLYQINAKEYEFLRNALPALSAQQEAEKNEPLTLEEVENG